MPESIFQCKALLTVDFPLLRCAFSEDDVNLPFYAGVCSFTRQIKNKHLVKTSMKAVNNRFFTLTIC